MIPTRHYLFLTSSAPRTKPNPPMRDPPTPSVPPIQSNRMHRGHHPATLHLNPLYPTICVKTSFLCLSPPTRNSSPPTPTKRSPSPPPTFSISFTCSKRSSQRICFRTAETYFTPSELTWSSPRWLRLVQRYLPRFAMYGFSGVLFSGFADAGESGFEVRWAFCMPSLR